MNIKKIGIITGSPYASTLQGCFMLITDTGDHYGISEGGCVSHQLNTTDEGYRKATESEISRHWFNISKHWDPQEDDDVVITQEGYLGIGKILGSDTRRAGYYRVITLPGGHIYPFTKEQMILSPNHGWYTVNIEKPEAVSETVSESIVESVGEDTSDKFSEYHPDVVDELRKIDVGFVDLITSRLTKDIKSEKSLAKVIMRGFVWLETPESQDFWSNVKRDLAKKDYEKANQLYRELKNPDDSKFNKAITEEARNLDENLWKLIQLRITRKIDHCKKLWEILDNGFIWSGTEESEDFWYDIYTHLKKEDYSKTNQCYNNFIQKSSKDKENLAKPALNGFEIGEKVQVEEPGIGIYEAKIVSISHFSVEIEIKLNNYPATITGNSHTIRKHVPHSSIYKLNKEPAEPTKVEEYKSSMRYVIRDGVLTFQGQEIRIGDIISFYYRSDLQDRVKVISIDYDGYTGSMPFQVEGGNIHWPVIESVRDLVNHSSELPTIPLQQMSFTAGNGTNNLFIGNPTPTPTDLTKNYNQEPIKFNSKPKKQFTIV